jgi:dTDP-glucose 4,6-dehydratase/UDP-glucose 4-epimerase
MINVGGNYVGAKVLITGGLGFIGSNLAQQLVNYGAEVTLVDSLIPEYGGNEFNVKEFRDRINVNISDVRDPFGMSFLIKGKDYLFNLAGQTSHLDSMRDPHTDLNINAGAQLSILEACRLHNPKIRIVFASTRQIYGKPKYLPVNEEHPIYPVDVNGINKLAGEWYHLLYNNVYNIRSSVLRLTNTYGPRMRVKDARQTFLGVWVRNLIENQPIKVYGDGLQLRDFNYVDDVVEALLKTGTSNSVDGEIFNLGSSEVINLKDLASLMTSIYKEGSYEIVPFPPERKVIDIGDYYSNFEKIKAALKWTPSINLSEGLATTLDFYEKNYEHYWGNSP